MNAVLINGQPVDLIRADDRGLLYGDGIFTTLAVEQGHLQHVPAHIKRLQRDALRLAIPFPDAATLRAEAQALCAGSERAVLKIILTRGAGGRGYRPPEPARPSRILALHPWPDHPASHAEQGVAVRLCTTRLGHNPALAGIKHLNRLEQVLARAEWDDPAIAEGLLRDQAGQLTEGTMSNVFLVQDGRLLTPLLDRCGVAGIMRARVLALAGRLGLECAEQRLDLADIAKSEAMFLCNSLIGIWPVRRFEQQHFTVDNPVIRKLQRAAGSGAYD